MFEIILNHSRAFGGYEAITSKKDMEAWQAIASHYSNTEIVNAEHGRYNLMIDWSTRVRYEESYCRWHEQFEGDLAKTSLRFEFERVHVCPATAIPERAIDFPSHTAEHGLHRLLIEIYLVANLSCPGTFNLYRSYIRNTRLDPAKDPLAQTELDLSEYVFETAWHEGQRYPWLGVGFLPFSEVLDWYNTIQIRQKSASTNDLERTLFSLLHLGRASFLEPTAVLWLASALEALFDTPSGSSFTFLCKRIAILLNLGKAETNELKRKLRTFFDVRNAFAHGGSTVLHPLADDRDKLVQSGHSELLNVTDFASAVVIGSIQELIRRGWKGVTFEERILPL